MKAFWWFKDDSIAGMARPGFNSVRWFDLTFDEAIVMGWLGQHSSGKIDLKEFDLHVASYVPKVVSFYNLTGSQREKFLESFRDPKQFAEIVNRIAARTRFIGEARIEGTYLHLETHAEQLATEIEFLRAQKIGKIVSLTESHHAVDELSPYFDLHHISIPDMGAPTHEQAEKLAQVLETAEMSGGSVAVHCLAGIGRTSTMIMAAELLRGGDLERTLKTLELRNPYYKFVGSQAEFVRSLKSKLESKAK